MDPFVIIVPLLIVLAALWIGYLHGLDRRSETPRTITQMPPDFTQRERERLQRVLDTAVVIPSTGESNG